ncbi:universal stress protein [Actinoplanes regularis]|uniref:universal stress protein n=1 Tax=Actinoplanes regularis TaxID=52697 RepID=UPI0024A5B4FE|nr:universal stress protein [Actinoplanes regularis]GLW35786.1 universal stress protein UspA [Actinoplanes regularis]
MNKTGLTRIIAGVCASPASRRAVEAAAREAADHDYPLHLIHAFDWPPGVAEDCRDLRGLLEEAVEAAAAVAPTLTITTELVEDDPLTGLLRLSRHAALTVIGDGNLNELVCLTAEAMAVQLAARAFNSVMITRAVPPPDGPILAGITDYETSDQVLDFAFDTAAHRQTGLTLVHVRETGSPTRSLDQTVAAYARAYGVDPCLRILEGDPTTVMTREAREASLIVAGARGHSPYHGLLGSVTQTLLHHGRAPIVVIRGCPPTHRLVTRAEARSSAEPAAAASR